MSRTKRRPFTAMERQEVYDLCFQGRLGGVNNTRQQVRIEELYTISPDEYREIGGRARKAADATINPLASDDGEGS